MIHAFVWHLLHVPGSDDLIRASHCGYLMTTLGRKEEKNQPGTSVSIKMYSAGNIECLIEHPSDSDAFDQLCVQQKR